MERSVSVPFDRNIQDHLWGWSTYFGHIIPTEIPRSNFDKSVHCPCKEFGKGLKNLKGVWYPKYGDVHEKFIFLETQDLKPLRTGQKHFETILPNFPPDECKI